MAMLTALPRTAALLSAAVLALATASANAQAVTDDDVVVVDDGSATDVVEVIEGEDVVDAGEKDLVATDTGEGEVEEIAYFTTMSDGANLRDVDIGASEEAAEMAADQAASRAVEKAVSTTAKGPEEQAR